MITHRQLFLNHIAQTTDNPMLLEVERAQGVVLYKPDGSECIDVISGISVCSLGHSHPKIVQAVKDQAEKYMHLMVYGEFVQSPQVKYAELLTSLLPDNLENVYFVNSGSEATETALKLAKRYTGRSEIISFRYAYHGSTHGALSIMGDEHFKTAFRPLLSDVKIIDYNVIEQLERITEKTACVIIEPMQGEAGVRLASNEFLQALRKRCDETGTLLIFDEVQTGFGRTGKMFGFQHSGVVPDIINFAKSLGGGMPLGAVVSSKEILDSFTNNPFLGHITTFGGHPVSCAAGLAMLTEITENKSIIEQIPAKEAIIREVLQHPLIAEIRGKGMFFAVEIKQPFDVHALIFEIMEAGVLADYFLFNEISLRIAPPLIISEEELRKALGIIISVLDRHV